MNRVFKFTKETLFLVLCLGYLSPIYIVITNAFKNRAELYENMLALPKSFDFIYFEEAIQKMDLVNSFKNSLVVTVISIAIIVVLSSMTAWMIVRTNNRISNLLFLAFVATMLIPFQTLMMPLMQTMGWISKHTPFQMIDTISGLVYMNVGFGVGMAVFLYHGFIKSIPVSLEEAAIIDGCNKLQVFWRVVFPLLKPVSTTVIILDVIWIWNDYLLPSLALSSKAKRTIPLSTASFFGQFTIQWNMAMAGLLVAISPVIIFYLLAQKHIIKGVATGAIK